MPENFVRVYLTEENEQRLTDFLMAPSRSDNFVQVPGSVNGSEVPVRFYRTEA